VFFCFQAEDGIRDRNVTGVQTCALPISPVDRTDDDGGIMTWTVVDSPIGELRLVAEAVSLTAIEFSPFATDREVADRSDDDPVQIGRASCRERGAGREVAGERQAGGEAE